MNNRSMLNASFLDILFEGRNKDYGAYELRTTYPKRLTKAITVTLGLVTALILFTAFAKKKKDSDESPFRNIGPVVVIEIPPEEEKEIPKTVPERIEPPQTREVLYSTIDIAPDNEVVTTPPTQDEIADARVGLQDLEGTKDVGITTIQEPVGDTRGVISGPQREPEDEILTIVEIPASVVGGDAAWRKYLERNLRANIPVDNGAPQGMYQVVVQFVVSVDGSISAVKALTSHGYGMEQEAVRVISKGPKWKPGIQNGRPVKSYHKQPITFMVTEEQ